MKFSTDIEKVTIGELRKAQNDGDAMYELIVKNLADDMGTPISEEAARRILDSKSVREFNRIQADFLEDCRSKQTTAMLSDFGQPGTK